ncbi:hypothetical protein ACTXPD_18575 [Vreelandella alkaliphila]|uniref:hypothetical protein n=1 Tax=Vreelandella alkaliphila TaxID=272774 RepID=UPI003FD6D503
MDALRAYHEALKSRPYIEIIKGDYSITRDIPFKPHPNDLSFRAHEKIENKSVETPKDVELTDEWLGILKDHPVMKKETIKMAINNGLTFEEEKNANDQGIRKFAKIVNRYCSRKLN